MLSRTSFQILVTEVTAESSIFCKYIGSIDHYSGNFTVSESGFYLEESGVVEGDIVGNYTADQSGVWVSEYVMFGMGSLNLTTTSGSLIVDWNGFINYYWRGIETPNGTILFTFLQKGVVRGATGEYRYLVGRPFIREGSILSGSPDPSDMTMHTTQGTLTIHEITPAMRKEIDLMRRQLVASKAEFEGLRTALYTVGIGCLVAGIAIGFAASDFARRSKKMG